MKISETTPTVPAVPEREPVINPWMRLTS